MSDRKSEILDLATELIQTKGYSAFSYQDLSDRLGIRKASIHHHYPKKEDLGKAVLGHYMDRAKKNLELIAKKSDGPWELLAGFFELVRSTQQDGNRICCIGSIQSTSAVVPQQVRDTASELARFIVSWLSDVLTLGRSEGTMSFKGKPEVQALAIFCAMQGAMQMNRAEAGGILESVTGQVKANLSP